MAFSFSPGRSGIHSADVSGFWSSFYLRRGKSTQVNTSVCFSWARCFCSLIKVLRSRLRSLGNYKIWVNFLYYGTSYNKEDEHMLWALRCLSRELFDKISYFWSYQVLFTRGLCRQDRKCPIKIDMFTPDLPKNPKPPCVLYAVLCIAAFIA